MTWRGRGVSLVVAGALLALLLTARAVTPSPLGHGTHLALGLPPCGWATWFHAPCPTCGMTTACSLAAHGRPFEAFKTQPLGFLVAMAAGGGFWVGLYGAATGSAVHRILAPLWGPRAWWALLIVALASWAWVWARWNPLA